MTITNNPLDVAVSGKGYFMVEMPSGETAYTRAGSFQVGPSGDIVTGDGYLVQPGGTIPPDSEGVTINDSGEVFANIAGQVAPLKVGQFELAAFPNEAGLQSIGDNLLLETQASGQPSVGVPGSQGLGPLNQGALEMSNVNVVTEVTNLITAQRAYEMNSRVIQAADEMMQSASQLR
jgi:flagellar basal-body rod protein FlgG